MKYRVMLIGESFELIMDGKTQNCGFVTTRWVKAKCEKEAELLAVELIKNDQDLIGLMADEPSLTPSIYVEEIVKAKWWKRLGGQGFSFYGMS